VRTFRNTNFKIFFALSLSVIPNFSKICRLGKTEKFSNTATRRKCSWKQPHFRNIKKLAISSRSLFKRNDFNPLKPELNPICYLLALLAHHFLHVSRIRVKSLTIRLLMSYIYGAPILDVSRSHTTTQHSR